MNIHFVAILFCLLSLITLTLSAETANVNFQSLLLDKNFFLAKVFEFLSIKDQFKLRLINKSLSKIIRKHIMSQIVRNYKFCFPVIPITWKGLKEFKVIWIISRMQDELTLTEKKNMEVLTRLDLYLIMDSPSENFRERVLQLMFYISCREFEFPELILQLLKVTKDEEIFKSSAKKIFCHLNTSPYKDSIRFFAKEIYKCKRNELPDRAYRAGHVDYAQKLYCMDDFNNFSKVKIAFMNLGWFLLQIISVTAIAYKAVLFFNDDANAIQIIQALYAASAIIILYEYLVRCINDYENYE